MDSATRDSWNSLSVAAVSDALDRRGITGQCLGIRPLSAGFRLLGNAVTVRYAPCGSEAGTVGDYIDEVQAGEVVVLDNGGRLDATVWGDILTEVAHRRGIAGTVIHGACRDVARSLQLGYPIFSRGATMRTGKDRVQVEACNVPVSLGEVRIEPGDLLFGDADGVVAVPKTRQREVLEIALQIEARENQIREAVAAGMRLEDARRAAGYHALQRRAPGKD
ncbi:MAG: RraA family protein [Burkholderiales bacterium]|nr:RraA family protein [Burkholderiales bacterium]